MKLCLLPYISVCHLNGYGYLTMWYLKAMYFATFIWIEFTTKCFYLKKTNSPGFKMTLNSGVYISYFFKLYLFIL